MRGPRSRKLTPRELDILVRVSFGMSNDAIAEDLGIASNTVRTHVQNVLTKLHARNRAHALGIVFRHGGFESFQIFSEKVASRG